MKYRLGSLVIVLMLNATTVGRQRHEQAQVSSPCGVIEQALRDYQQVRVGAHREDVEVYFQREGGLQFPGKTHYVYSGCRYLHLDVEFDVKGNANTLFSPNDIVVGVSKLYVAYTSKD